MPIWMLTAGAFLKKHWPLFAIVILALVLVLFIFSAGGSHEREAQDQRTIKIERDVGAANENASAARVEDATVAQQQKKELNDANENAVDADDARRRRGCAILRQQGRDTAGIPACR